MIPPIVTDLTVEQQLRLRTLNDSCLQASKEDLIDLADYHQRMIFILQNTMATLVSTGNWDEANETGA
jgi:hypothetical protein|tara:strand:+ start:410 stop:613 length:204 start_codon:yes stop_codon:yes gene_type:complete